MSTSNLPHKSWWAGSGTRARLTLVGAGVLALALIATSVFVWFSPVSPVAQAAVAQKVDLRQEALVKERNELLSMVVDLRADLAASKTSLSTTEGELDAIQTALWSAEGKLTAEAAADAAKKADKKSPAVRKPGPKSPTIKPGTTTITAPSKAELVAPESPYFGMYTEQAPFNWATFDATTASLGTSPSVVGYFSGWDEDFRANAVTRAWEKGKMPFLTWEARPISGGNGEGNDLPEYSLPRILGDPAAGVPGAFDDYLRQYARDIVATGLPLGIRLNHEMNGNWYPWSETKSDGSSINGNRVGDYAKVWKHVHDIFEQEGANEQVIWVWSPNIINNLRPSMKSQEFLAGYYPGDEYVDWVGLSGYLRPPYRPANDFTFDYSFGASLEQLRTLTDKPIFLSEVGASETDGHKADWIASFFDGIQDPKNDDIIGFGWFSLTVTSRIEGELGTNDWRIDSSPASVEAFKAGFALPGNRFVLEPAG